MSNVDEYRRRAQLHRPMNPSLIRGAIREMFGRGLTDSDIAASLDLQIAFVQQVTDVLRAIPMPRPPPCLQKRAPPAPEPTGMDYLRRVRSERLSEETSARYILKAAMAGISLMNIALILRVSPDAVMQILGLIGDYDDE